MKEWGSVDLHMSVFLGHVKGINSSANSNDTTVKKDLPNAQSHKAKSNVTCIEILCVPFQMGQLVASLFWCSDNEIHVCFERKQL